MYRVVTVQNSIISDAFNTEFISLFQYPFNSIDTDTQQGEI